MQNVYKVFVTCPKSHTATLIEAMSQAGAGNVGNYTHCAFITDGFGNYKPQSGSNPYKGEVGQMSREEEDKIEMVCPKENLEKVVQAIKDNHPYETPTIDIIESKLFT